jgi:hypothetical protein
VPSFADLYLKGLLKGGGYFEIPLEQNAYALGNRREGNPLHPLPPSAPGWKV